MINVNGQPQQNNPIIINPTPQTLSRVTVTSSLPQNSAVSANPVYGPAGRGIVNVLLNDTDGLVDEYLIYYTDGTTSSFYVTNGDYISNIELTSTEGLVDTYTITFGSGNTYSFTVTNGEQGIQGVQGEQGIQGETGETGNGIASIEKTSTSGLVDTYTITYTNGDTSTFTVTNGQDGTDGQDGADGFSPTATVTKSGDTATITITDKDGTTTATITDGSDAEVTSANIASALGYTPVDPSDLGTAAYTASTDYATAAQGNLADTAIQPNDNISSLNNDVGYITGINSTDVTSALGYTPYNSTNPNGYITSSSLNDYVTLNTLQTLSSGKKIFANDAVMAGNQTALLATISNSNTNTTDNAWVGRYICGAKNLTFLMGTYRKMAGIGAHSWSNAQTGSSAAWADFYLNPDGDKAVYIGGYLWTKDSGWLKVKNSGNASGTVQVNKGTISSPSWKDVACWSDNVSKFTNDAGYITSAALSGYATETWVGNQGYLTGITSSDVTTALGYTPYNSNNPDGFISGIDSTDVTTALGYTPYNASNPNGYTSNVGTVTSINNVSPDNNGNVSLTIPSVLGDLSNVSISNPTAGQNLTYDAANNVWKNTSTSATVAWGGITGTLTDQTDLKNALDGKQATATYDSTKEMLVL